MTKTTILLLNIAGTASIVYFAMILFFSGIKTSFLWFWPFFATCCLGASFLLRFAGKHTNDLPWRILSPVMLSGIWAAFTILFLVECFILRAACTPPSGGADYMVILGAQVRGDVPSLTLKARIDAAAEYLLAHPQVVAICSGGQGSGENKSEAAAIRDGLVAAGVAKDRILLEEASTNTVENLRFCRDMLPSANTPTVIVTSDFHCRRAGLIAQKHGYLNVSTLPATQFLLTTPHYFLREFFALVKDFLVGNL